MTEDYKKNLIDYVTDTLETSSLNDNVSLQSTEGLDRPYRDEIKALLDTNSISFGQIIATKNNQNNNTNLSIVNGTYYPKGSYDISDLKTYVALIDRNYNLIKLFDDYDNNPNKLIQNLSTDENGNLYGIDGIPQSDGSLTNCRFIMFNNPILPDNNGNYKLVLRYSLYLPSSTGMNNSRRELQFYLNKAVGSSKYLFGLYHLDSGGNYNGIYFSELIINVGSPNEWNNYRTTDSLANGWEDTISYWDDENIYIRFLSTATTLSPKMKYVYEFNLSSGSFVRTQLYSKSYVNEDDYVIGLKFYSYDNFIMSINYRSYIEIYRYNNGFSLLHTETSTIENTEYFLNIYNLDEYVYINTTLLGTETPGETEWKEFMMFLIDSNNIYKIPFEENRIWGDVFVDRKEFNLISIDYEFYQEYSVLRAKIIFNSNNYNGQTYISSDALVPKLSNLYSGNSLIFSRNLYNITKQNNQTMSSVEIPNTYLNNEEINQNNLISKTNLTMNNDSTNWNKNIYEVVDVNFINTISVIDEDTNTSYLASAIKVNNATTDGGDTNYQNTPCNKARLNYSDSTNQKIPIYWSSIDNTHKEVTLSFYADKVVNSIDFISNDETTIYLTIPVETEVGKFYTLSQKIKIE